MATFILVHGAFAGGWCWERLVPLLEAAGHRAVAPDLPGMTGDATLESWSRFIGDLARVQPEKPILVGHSRGGLVISQTGEDAADDVAGLVYVAAVLIPNGESVASLMGSVPPPATQMSVEPTEDGRAIRMHSDDAIAGFFHLAAPEWKARVRAMAGPEPRAPSVAPLALTDEGFCSLRRAYVECALDASMALAMQRQMHQALPCDPVITLQSDHSPFYSQPNDLAAALGRIAQSWGS